MSMGLEGRRWAIRGRRIRGLGSGERSRMGMGMQLAMDRCGESRVMAGEVESVDRGGWEGRIVRSVRIDISEKPIIPPGVVGIRVSIRRLAVEPKSENPFALIACPSWRTIPRTRHFLSFKIPT